MGDRAWGAQLREAARREWGDRYPGATDWMRRAASESRWGWGWG
jgi:hypothetical protein